MEQRKRCLKHLFDFLIRIEKVRRHTKRSTRPSIDKDASICHYFYFGHWCIYFDHDFAASLFNFNRAMEVPAMFLPKRNDSLRLPANARVRRLDHVRRA